MNDWMPHGYCFLWQQWILLPMVLSNTAITASYFWIGGSLFRIREYAVNPSNYNISPDWSILRLALISFGLFIVSCGITHLFDIVVIWRPYYDVQVVCLIATAIFSSLTAWWLQRLVQIIDMARIAP